MEIEEIIRLLPLLLGGKASKEQEQEVSRWLEEDEGNPVLYKELCATYYKLHYACRWTDIDPVAASSKIRSGLEKKSVRLRLTAWVSGVAAILVVGLCISYFIHREDSVIPERIIVKDVKSGEKKALLTLADGRQVELKSGPSGKYGPGDCHSHRRFAGRVGISGERFFENAFGIPSTECTTCRRIHYDAIGRYESMAEFRNRDEISGGFR